MIKSCFISTLIFVGITLALLVAGGFVGGRLLTPESAMGWDAIANMLGGLMIGGLTGAIISILLLMHLNRNEKYKKS